MCAHVSSLYLHTETGENSTIFNFLWNVWMEFKLLKLLLCCIWKYTELGELAFVSQMLSIMPHLWSFKKCSRHFLILCRLWSPMQLQIIIDFISMLQWPPLLSMNRAKRSFLSFCLRGEIAILKLIVCDVEFSLFKNGM